MSFYDPKVNSLQIEKELKLENHKSEIPKKNNKWSFHHDKYESTLNADALIILTDADEFKCLDWEKISKNMRAPAWIFDAKGFCNTTDIKKFGLKLWTIGIG